MSHGQPADQTPVADYEIDSTLVAKLLATQHPDLADLPLEAVTEGWDNATYRLGDSLAVRLPRRSIAAVLIENEQAWLPCIADRLTLPVPVPCRIGRPTDFYPCSWSVVPWLQGVSGDQKEPLSSEARTLAVFLRSLHTSAPTDAPPNPFRGVPLEQRAASVETRMERLAVKTELVTPRLRQIWDEALDAPLDMQPTLLHGDLHPRNVLVDRAGKLCGIIDWGDITTGDCATDLAAIWMLFGSSADHKAVLTTYGAVSEATVRRAKGWAVLFGVLLLDTGHTDNPRNALIGERILRRVVL
jgi:aminoglycoside phosphotransferase (APT) family kinase protein